MKDEEFWQNFELGIEIDIASSFIYDGLKNFYQMDSLDLETEIFSVLYCLSIGIERFLKVAIILIEFNVKTDRDEFEKSLITHNHSDLMSRIRKNKSINLSKVHNEFISLLSNFYKKYRYDRYKIDTINHLSKEKKALVSFLSNYNIIEGKLYINLTTYQNTSKAKKFLKNLISKIILQLYNIIEDCAREKNIYTYELRYGSKAQKLLLGEGFNHINEDMIWKEILLFLMNTKQKSQYLSLMKSIKPLNLDIALIGEYLQVFNNKSKSDEVLEEIENLYSENKISVKDRLNLLDFIGGNPSNYIFHEDEGQDGNEDENGGEEDDDF
jgi:sulfur relay (sulfurtransferase) DsrC/TusE family protein